MLTSLMILAALCVSSDAGEQPSNTSADGIAGVWVILLEGHQIGLGLEQDGRKVTGTLQIMGRNVPVDGEFVDPTLTLSGEASVGAHGDQQAVPMKLTARLKEDGTLEGEMSTARGPMKFTAERLKPRIQ